MFTNQKLSELLLSLGYESHRATQPNFRLWRHPASGCVFVLPANKSLEAARPADIVGIKAQLSLQGHMDEEAFEMFAAEGRLPADLPKRG